VFVAAINDIAFKKNKNFFKKISYFVLHFFGSTVYYSGFTKKTNSDRFCFVISLLLPMFPNGIVWRADIGR